MRSGCGKRLAAERQGAGAILFQPSGLSQRQPKTWHYLAPPSMHWMADDAAKTVSTSLFSGVLFMSFFLYLRDRV